MLSRAHAEYDRLFNLSLDLICIAGLDGYFRRVNPSWTRVLGWSEAELLARPVEEFMHPDDRERTLKARAGLAQGIPVRGLENRYLCKDGSFRWLSWQSTTEPSGTTVFAVARDITEHRQIENERMILSKLESTGVLAGGIAHDFNNLLAGILLNLEMVGFSKGLTPDEQAFLLQACSAVRNAGSLTQQLITFAKGGAPVRRITDLRQLLREALDETLCGSSIGGESVVAPDLWLAEVDQAQLRQVLRNVVLNAREATSNGGTVRLEASNVTLSAKPGLDSLSGDFIRITVHDFGAGIRPDVLPRIFDPYFSTKQRGAQKGMGLGLTISRTIVQQHGGSIAVDSRESSGTTVIIHLPAQRVAIGGTVSPTPLPEPAREERRVLVMDDEALLRDTLARMLHRLGFGVEVAEDGSDAVTLYQQAVAGGRPFSAVLLDLTVRGGMGGIETLARLQSIDPDVRAILMTGYTNEEVFQDPRRRGFHAALAKPFSAAALRALLEEILAVLPSSPR